MNGKKMKQRRQDLNLTQQELGQKVGVTTQYISYLETGLKKPSLEMAQRIAKALDVSIDELAK